MTIGPDRTRLEVAGFFCLGCGVATWASHQYPDGWLTAIIFFVSLGVACLIADLVILWRRIDAQRSVVVKGFECPHDDLLCKRYGCPSDPNWIGDRS